MFILSVSKTERKYCLLYYPGVRCRDDVSRLPCHANLMPLLNKILPLWRFPWAVKVGARMPHIYLISCLSQMKTLPIYFKQKELSLKCGIAFRALNHVISRNRVQHLICASSGVQFKTGIFSEMLLTEARKDQELHIHCFCRKISWKRTAQWGIH